MLQIRIVAGAEVRLRVVGVKVDPTEIVRATPLVLLTSTRASSLEYLLVAFGPWHADHLAGFYSFDAFA